MLEDSDEVGVRERSEEEEEELVEGGDAVAFNGMSTGNAREGNGLVRRERDRRGDSDDARISLAEDDREERIFPRSRWRFPSFIEVIIS